MKYQLVNNISNKQPIAIAFYSDQSPDKQSHIEKFKLTDALATELLPKQKQTCIWVDYQKRPCLLYNLGKQGKLKPRSLKTALESILKQAKSLKLDELLIALPTIEFDSTKKIGQFIVQSIENSLYQYKITQKSPKPISLKRIDFLLENITENEIDAAQHIASGIKLAQDLANQPPNQCTPMEIANTAATLANTDPKFALKVLDEEQMSELGMNTILAVSKGSDEPARFIELKYQNGGDQSPIVLVGKGITFDSGGLSLKPPPAMFEMKYDMCGAATVLGVLKAISLLKLPLNVVGLIACSENLPGPKATKPGSVIESFSKKTIEILNTDAEGRLVLCDALTYAEQFNPSKVIDIATLTGAIIIALGSHTNGVMGNDQALCDALLSAGKAVDDKGWQLPLWDEYQTAMDSNIADVCNTAPNTSAGSISAGCFLSRFAENYSWAHIDCAGTAWESGKQKNATGRPVPMLVEFLQNEANSNAR